MIDRLVLILSVLLLVFVPQARGFAALALIAYAGAWLIDGNERNSGFVTDGEALTGVSLVVVFWAAFGAAVIMTVL